MTKEEFHKIMDHPFDLTQEETNSINKLIEKHPYFLTARLLSLRGIKNHAAENYNESLKKVASYSTDRTLLFDYITHKKILEKNILEEAQKAKEITTSSIHQENTNSEEAFINPAKPKEFNKNEFHSFSQWLKISTQNLEDESINQNAKFSAIDRFIELNPKLSPIKDRQKNIDIALNSITENQNLMTETLAKIYVEQKKYDKAIQAFKILSLKYPEKSGFFADQIKAIKKLDKK
ncbi:hypothetical protein UJ101_00982 [Flavobacteriaceae bacterium UJ101]|nr:hypothetical protein UJ101_00982 [Flavobacteriaceae bacterium UJ101]